MKDQRDKSTNESTSKSPGKSLYQLYHELLYLREEVREAEQEDSGRSPKSPKPHR